MSSFQERFAAVRAEREREREFVLPVPGYETVGLHARYRLLEYADVRNIYKNVEDDEPETELAAFADTLARACKELLVKQDDGSFQSLGCRWTSAGVRDQLGIDLPEGAGMRDAIFAVFNGPGGTNDLARHFNAYEEATAAGQNAVDESIVGESNASSAPEEPSTSQ